MAVTRKRGSGRGRKNLFEKLGRSNLLYPVFARLDAQSIDVARQVCRQWNQVLTSQFITSLSCRAPTVSLPAFLVVFQYEGLLEAQQAVLVMDAHGRCLTPTPNLSFIKAVAPNGLVVTSLSEQYMEYYGRYKLRQLTNGDSNTSQYDQYLEYFCRCKVLQLTNVGSNVSSIIGPPRPLPPQDDMFRGAYFDPAAQAFTYLEGYNHVDFYTNTSYIDLYTYTSTLQCWTKQRFPFPADSQKFMPYGNGVFSWETFFWIRFGGDGACKGVVAFSPSKQQFSLIPFPVSSLPDVQNISAVSSKRWQLRGCEGNVFLFQEVFTAANGNSKACWKLVPSGTGYAWENFSDLWHKMSSAHAFSYACDVCPQFQFRTYYNVDTRGWWFLAGFDDDKQHKAADDTDHRHQAVFQLFDNAGNLKSCISMSQVVQSLQIPNALYIEEVWPFEINNICWPKHVA